MMPIDRRPIYDPAQTYEYNFDHGPFGEFSRATFDGRGGVPKYKFLGYPIHSPFGIPAGPLLNSNYVRAALAKGFDVVCYKTQRSVSFDCNAFPNVLNVDIDGDLTLKKAERPLIGMPVASDSPGRISITNSFGNPSRGPAYWIEDLRKGLSIEGEGQLVIMSVVGTIQPGFDEGDYFNDFAATAKLAAETKVKAIEINLSCPNVANEGILCYAPAAVAEICRRVKHVTGSVPLIAKLGYYGWDQQELLENVVKQMAPYVAAISAVNTIPAPVVDRFGKQALPGVNRLKSGICGAGIKWAGLEITSRLAELRNALGLNYEIIGVGGVMSGADFLDYRRAGADIVQSATGAMWNANLATEIKACL